MPRNALYWNPVVVEELMRRNGIRTRSHLALVLKLSSSTVHAAFDASWSGSATTVVLSSLACKFGVSLDSLVLNPRAARQVRIAE